LKLKQFLLQDPLLPDGRIALSGKDYRYLVRVRRVKPGDVISAVAPDGVRVRLAVIDIGKATLWCGVEEVCTEKPADGQPSIILLQAIPQPAKMDILVRQATEGGVSAIVPFASRYSAKLNEAVSKVERWRRIVREARQQSGSPIATVVADICGSPIGVLDYYRTMRDEKTAALMMHEKEIDGGGVLHRELAARPNRVFIVVGPEGGLSDEETSLFIQNGFIMINMGSNILRVETAAAWAVGTVSIILREAEFWKSKE
jgi:16S rRNA (uracil1498-N3)-methyltransferase